MVYISGNLRLAACSKHGQYYVVSCKPQLPGSFTAYATFCSQLFYLFTGCDILALQGCRCIPHAGQSRRVRHNISFLRTCDDDRIHGKRSALRIACRRRYVCKARRQHRPGCGEEYLPMPMCSSSSDRHWLKARSCGAPCHRKSSLRSSSGCGNSCAASVQPWERRLRSCVRTLSPVPQVRDYVF